MYAFTHDKKEGRKEKNVSLSSLLFLTANIVITQKRPGKAT